MEYHLLNELIKKDYSISQISEVVKKSKTTVRYWLKKYSLQTTWLKEKQNKITCKVCKERYVYNRRKNRKYSCGRCIRKNSRVNRKNKCLEIKGWKCKNCDYSKNISALHFHHRDSKEKEFSLSTRNICSYSWVRVLKELNKCDLLCANCHHEEHERINSETKNKTKFASSIKKKRTELKEKMLQYKEQKCSRCGYKKSNSSLCFHHVDKTNKLLSFSKIIASPYSFSEKEIYEELDKCELLCANCHHEVHSQDK